jgi:hypothetical protein
MPQKDNGYEIKPIQNGIYSVSNFNLCKFKIEYPKMQQNTAMIKTQFLK